MDEKVTLKTLKSREKEARKDLIIDAAERVFATKPVDKATMREIADEAGMATSSIYRFFPNQEAILIAAAVRTQSKFNQTLDKYFDDQKPEDSLKRVLKIYIDFISENDTYFRMMTILMSQGNLNIESSKALVEVMNESLLRLDRIFRLMKFSDNPRPLSRYIYASIVGISVSYNKLPGINPESRLKHMQSLSDLLFDMIIHYPRDSKLPG
ncbi:MAG TPA: TetR/AcrR family transcriptional regulator [Spirochaetota bacterium]|nr:TetR/AcrR family transcriptional regulator [Spirochaetota bacterium]